MDADLSHAQVEVIADSIYIQSDKIGIAKRIANRPLAYFVLAIEEDKQDAVVVMSSRNNSDKHALITTITAVLEKIKSKSSITTETIEFKTKEEFENAVGQLKSMGIPVGEAVQ